MPLTCLLFTGLRQRTQEDISTDRVPNPQRIEKIMEVSQIVRKSIAVLAALLASVAMSFTTVNLVSASSVEAPRPTADPIDAGEGATSSSVVVPPWCAWYLNGSAATIDLAPADEAKYVGEDLVVTAESPDMYAYIGSDVDQTSAMAGDNCSWFGATPWNAEFTVSIDGTKFTANTSSGQRDSEMDFYVSDDSPISIEPTLTGCDVSFTKGPASQLPDGVATEANVWTNVAGGTNDFCSFKFNYSVTIPGGLIPSYGGTTYIWTGPKVTHTVTVTDPDA